MGSPLFFHHMKKYSFSIIGGTFDHFHSGHEHFLHEACVASKHLTIGLTTEVLHANKEYRHTIEDFETRKSSVEEFISLYHPEISFEIIPLNDIYGTTLKEERIDAIFTTEHGLENTHTINKKRIEKRWQELQIELVQLVKGNDGETISSTRIRKGEIDRRGFSYPKLFSKNLRLTDDLKPEFQKAWGDVLTDDETIANVLSGKKIITVGDVVSKTVRKLEIKPLLLVIDQKSERNFLSEVKSDTTIQVNKAGEINTATAAFLFDRLDAALLNNVSQTVVIDGEEDLLAFPLMLYAPLLSIVCYGLRDKGLVAVVIDEELKIELKNLASRMSFVE